MKRVSTVTFQSFEEFRLMLLVLDLRLLLLGDFLVNLQSFFMVYNPSSPSHVLRPPP